MKKIIYILLIFILTACDNLSLNKYNDNFKGYYKKVGLIVIENGKVISNNNTKNEYMEIDNTTITFSYYDNIQFKNKKYNYKLINNELVIDKIDGKWEDMTGTYKISYERNILKEIIILKSKYENILLYNYYELIPKEDYLVIYDEYEVPKYE